MDWKYKYFKQEAVFQAETGIVREALHAFAKDWLNDWKVSETWDGLEAKSPPGFRSGTAKFRIEPALGGTKVAIEMQVQRAASLGLMVFDFGGYYDGQIRKWLQALPWWIQQKQAAATQSAGQHGKSVPAGPPIPKPERHTDRLMGCVTILIVIVGSMYAIVALAGLVTGNLYIPGNDGGFTIHGQGARILAASFLVLFSWIAVRLWNVRKRNRESGWSPPS